MKQILLILLVAFYGLVFSQEIGGWQVFNPQTNDSTPVIGFNDSLILKFDDLSNSGKTFRYTYKHLDRNWQDDGLFFSEFAQGNLNDIVEDFQYSFNTNQKYTHYNLQFPNSKIRLKISGNYELIIYTDSQEKPLFFTRFSISENLVNLSILQTRYSEARKPNKNQRIEIQAIGNGIDLSSNINSTSLAIMQNNNTATLLSNLKPSGFMSNKALYQQLDLVFAGNNEFYYFNNKNISIPTDMVADVGNVEGKWQTYLFPVLAYPNDYQYMPDVDGAYYFRRNDLGIERDADKEGDYSEVYFALESGKTDKELYVLGAFNNYKADKTSQMYYDEKEQKYIAKIYLKQGFYNYIIATKNPGSDELNFGEVNGNFWQTENLYQAFLYYKAFGKNYDGLMGYGELRNQAQ